MPVCPGPLSPYRIAIRRNVTNIAFQAGDPASMHFDRSYDAIIGRFVLMYQDDPATSLRHMMRYLREGGLVVFRELDSTACHSWPTVPVFDEAARWLAEGLRSSGARPDLGLEMHSLFLDCGLPEPRMRMDTLVSGEGGSPVYKLLAEAVRSLAPTLEKANIASAAQVKIDSLADRMRNEVVAKRGIAMSYGLVGAWATSRSLTKCRERVRPSSRPGMAAVEQHIQYKRELHAGDAITVQSALFGSEGEVHSHAS
jgi:Methyltransferase domain